MDNVDSLVLVVVSLLLVLINGFFVAAEFAIVKTRGTRLDELISQGRSSAGTAKKLHAEMDRALSGTQLGITLASLGLGWLGEPAFAHLIEGVLQVGPWSTVVAHTISIAVAFLFITLLHLVFGELVPKTLAIRHSERTLLRLARPMRWFYQAAYPMIWFLDLAATVTLRVFGTKPAGERERGHSEEELRLILAHSSRSGLISREEQRLVESVFDLADRSARQVMVPRTDIIFLRVDRPFEENLRIARDSEHTRYPLCEGDIDHVIGIINVKDLLFRSDGVDLRAIRREILFAPEMKSVKELLREFQKTHLHMALVVDEYGSTAGLVTLEDIVEELIGEIQDEFDLESPKFQKIDEKSFRLAGNLMLEELSERLSVEIQDQENDTIAGHVMALLGRPARVGDTVRIGSYRLRVARTKRFRITELLLERIEPAPVEDLWRGRP
ncbi:MAG: HlyC/CorC family transporter [Acidobacteria bacterium]|nr:HlyC/CorC family transporter [Acidobacteriota bacterium]